ncbi:PREDICTED: WD repeat-containing protein 75 [Nelumbo nucifera]|uniref:WD repeat-containing protein 75 n=1 Tax=Nelumbo nucifera TaxID=4432 RepID=A0A1U8B917_NELNU|nr:PREDICTED: WD repeat-containing protein 75 [Nelumbo nucifera]
MITGGKSYVSSVPAFSNDGKKLLLCTGNTVSVFSTSTGMQITELEGHQAPVTSVFVVPISTSASKVLCYCWTSSLDGSICYWDFSVPELMKKVDVQLPIYSMVIPGLLHPQIHSNGKPSDLYAYVSVEDTSKQGDKSKVLRGQIRKCNLSESRLLGGVTLSETQHPEIITISASGEFFGIRNKQRLHVWKLPSKDSEHDVVRKMTLHHTKKLTILAFHPTERILAGGDVTGRILIWRGFGKRIFSANEKQINGRVVKHGEERPGVIGDDDADSCSTWHWHAAEVNALSFSSDGVYLYSGGREGVLVVWQLDTGKKRYLSRIGSPLLYFTYSPDPSLSLISCADNQIHLLEMPSMELSKSISGIKPPCSFPKIYQDSFNGIAFDHTAGLAAIRTENYRIQFYSLFDNREISQVQVCERNHQPGDDVTVFVTLLALSIDGSLMATAEVKLPEEGIGGLVCLKFWASGSQGGEFTLSTVIYEPHSDAAISAIAFHPTQRMAVSSSYGGDFKIWIRNNDQQSNQMLQKSGWRCHSVGTYKKKPITAATFSPDGSILAVAAETVVTLWDPDKNVLVAVVGETLMPIVTLSFVGRSEYLVSVSQGLKPQLSVWSMSKLSISWSYKLHAEAVACMIDASIFAVLVLSNSSEKVTCEESSVPGSNGLILLFNVEDPVPLVTWSVKKAQGGALAFLKVELSLLNEEVTDEKSSQAILAYVNSDHEYVIFDPYNRKDHKITTNHRGNLIPLEEAGRSGYTSIYGELQEFDINGDSTPQITFVPSERPWETIFSGSSHVLPPLTKLCSVFLESLLEKRSAVQD